MRVEFRRWYEPEALMKDLTVCRHEMLAASEEEIERRMRDRYVDAVAILAREMRAEVRLGNWFSTRPDSAAW